MLETAHNFPRIRATDMTPESIINTVRSKLERAKELSDSIRKLGDTCWADLTLVYTVNRSPYESKLASLIIGEGSKAVIEASKLELDSLLKDLAQSAQSFPEGD